jgi:hypothetical protein
MPAIPRGAGPGEEHRRPEGSRGEGEQGKPRGPPEASPSREPVK